MALRTLAAYCIMALLPACRSGTAPQKQIEQYAQSRFKAYQLLYNPSKTHVLAVENQPAGPAGMLHYLIFDTTNANLLAEGSFRPGYIKWLNDAEIEILDVPGMIRQDEDMNLFKKKISVSNLK